MQTNMLIIVVDVRAQFQVKAGFVDFDNSRHKWCVIKIRVKQLKIHTINS